MRTRTDDLAKNAIQMVGGADGSFDMDDYILFYAWGPNRTSTSGGELTQDRNTYSNVSCYFFNVNPSELLCELQSIPNADDPVTHTVSTYSYFQKHESETVSLVKGGKRFYGELFDTQLSQAFTMTLQMLILQVMHLLKCFLRQMHVQ